MLGRGRGRMNMDDSGLCHLGFSFFRDFSFCVRHGGDGWLRVCMYVKPRLPYFMFPVHVDETKK